MKNIFNIGDKKVYKTVVSNSDIAQFDSGTVHQVCSTFSLARSIEWSSRLFALDMKEEHEEGIGTSLSINHKSPALIGDELVITSELINLDGNNVICKYVAMVHDRIIAKGETGQKILKKEKIDRLFDGLRNE